MISCLVKLNLKDINILMVINLGILILFRNFIDNDLYYEDSDNYTDPYNYTTIMPNTTSPQDNILLTPTGWSEAGYNSTDMPLDMVFNDGHRLSIAVYRC